METGRESSMCSLPPLVPRTQILIDPDARRTPLTIVPLLRAERPAVGSGPERPFGHVAVDEGSQVDQPIRSSDRGDDESVQIVENRSCEELTEGPRIASVG